MAGPFVAEAINKTLLDNYPAVAIRCPCAGGCGGRNSRGSLPCAIVMTRPFSGRPVEGADTDAIICPTKSEVGNGSTGIARLKIPEALGHNVARLWSNPRVKVCRFTTESVRHHATI